MMNDQYGKGILLFSMFLLFNLHYVPPILCDSVTYELEVLPNTYYCKGVPIPFKSNGTMVNVAFHSFPR